MWAYESVFYQIYPMGFCGVPFENDGVQRHEIKHVEDWIPHMQKLGVNAVYFSPVFESDTHGYNTRDYRKIDVRLGTNEDFKEVCDALHRAGIRVVLDGVFNHVGRGFAQFQDVIRNRENSPYVNWFYRIDFGGNSNYNDGLWYEGWEGCFDLVKLNLQNPDVVNYLLDSVKGWIDEFGIDGLRLDVAYSLDENFVRRLREVTSAYKQDFFLLGEMLHGDYNRLMNDQMLHSATNYECYKGLYSSFNSMNMFEIVHSLLRQFGPENWTLYKGKHLLSFVDNHDVTRVASILNNENHLPLIYAMAFGMPGIPCVYYGSEWGFKARKEDGDPALRPYFDKPEWNGLCDWISKLTEAKKHSEALNYGAFRSVLLTNKQCIFERKSEHERVMVAINADGADFMAHFDAGCGTACQTLHRMDDFAAGRVVEGQLQRKAFPGSRSVFDLIQVVFYFFGETAFVADDPHAHSLSGQFGRFVDYALAEELHQGIDLCGGASPVFGRESIKRQVANPVTGRGLDCPAHGLHTPDMTFETLQPVLRGPASVAVHDNGDVSRYAFLLAHSMQI